MSSIIRHEPGRRHSRVVVHNQVAYFSGLTAHDVSGDIRAQTRATLAKADELLGKIGASRSDLLTAMIWLRNIDDFDAMNEVWETWIDSEHPPARATVEARMAAPDILVEIKFSAATGNASSHY